MRNPGTVRYKHVETRSIAMKTRFLIFDSYRLRPSYTLSSYVCCCFDIIVVAHIMFSILMIVRYSYI